MTLNSTPLWMQGLSTHTANMYRRWLDGLANLKSGIFTSGDFTVTQNGTPNMSVNVATGMAFVRGTEDATNQGMYWVENEASQNVSIGAAHATLNRIDLVVIRIRDNAYSTGPSNDATIFVVAGTPASSPSAPSAPPNSFILAEVTVGAAVTSIVTANIANKRTTSLGQGFASLRGAFRRCAAATKPNVSLQPFQDFIIEDDGLRLDYWNGSVWKAFTGAYTSSVGTYNTTTSLASTGATVTLPSGDWILQGKCEAANLAAAAAQTMQLQLWNSTAGSQVDTCSNFFASAILDRRTLYVQGLVSLTATTTFQLRGISTTGGANYPLQFINLLAFATMASV